MNIHCVTAALLLSAAMLHGSALRADESSGAAERDSQATFERDVRPVLREYCFGCHGPDAQEASLRLDQLGTNFLNGPDAETWHDVLNNLNLGEMPPKDSAALSAEQRNKVVGWLTAEFKKAAAAKRSTGGRVVLRRLTHYEYNNTMRDLIGIDRNYAEDLPPEPVSEDGFKNNGSTLGMSSIQLEYYLAAARMAMQKAIVTGPEPKVHRHLITDSKEVTRNKNKTKTRYASKRLQGSAEFVAKLMEFPREGEFLVRIKAAAAIPKGAGYPRLAVSLGVRSDTQTPNAQNGSVDVPGTPQPLSVLADQPDQPRPSVDQLPHADQLKEALAKLETLPNRRETKRLPADEQKQITADRKKLERLRKKLEAEIDDAKQSAADQAFAQKMLQPIDEPQVFEFRGQIDEFPLPGDNPKYPGLLVIVRNSYDSAGDQVEGADLLPKASVTPDKTTKKRKGKKPVKLDPTQPAIIIESVEFIGPIFAAWPPASHTQILFDSPDRDDESKYARQVLRRFMNRAWRRPVLDSDVEPMFSLFETIRPRVASFEEAMRETLAMVLISPEFLYLVEPQREAQSKGRLGDYELASRLSYFLWSTMPDDRLSDLATSGKLRDPKTLRNTVRRMIADPKSQQFVNNFTTQWLQLSGVDRVAVNPEYYPDFDDRLKPLMRSETQQFFAELLYNNLSALNLIDSDFTMVNRRLARHYGLQPPLGSGFQPAALTAEDRRGGLLSHASILLSNSTGDDSHTIRRGVWLLDRLLGDPPAPPPPDVPELNSESPDFAGLSTRKQLEIHRTKESCNSCHRGIDPWGIPFEHFDAVGLWRDDVLRVARKRGPDIKTPVDAKATLPDGSTVNGLAELKAYLLKHETERFSRALVEKLLTYSLGRSLEWTDEETVLKLAVDFRANDYNLQDLIVKIVASNTFQSK